MTSTVNANEVEKFSKVSWDQNGPMKPLFSYNSIRVPLIVNTLDLSSPSKKYILDIGSGGGFLSEGLALHLTSSFPLMDFQIIGLDPSAELVEIATQHLPDNLKNKVTYICSSIEDYVEKNPSMKFNTVVMSEVIEHVDHPKEFLQKAVEATKEGGSLILTTPAKTILSYLGTIVFAEYLTRMLPIGTHFYSKFISVEECTQLFETNNCTVKDIRGAFYNPITNTWRWINSKQFMYATHAIKN